jgi:hypothetical protein
MQAREPCASQLDDGRLNYKNEGGKMEKESKREGKRRGRKGEGKGRD